MEARSRRRKQKKLNQHLIHTINECIGQNERMQEAIGSHELDIEHYQETNKTWFEEKIEAENKYDHMWEEALHHQAEIEQLRKELQEARQGRFDVEVDRLEKQNDQLINKLFRLQDQHEESERENSLRQKELKKEAEHRMKLTREECNRLLANQEEKEQQQNSKIRTLQRDVHDWKAYAHHLLSISAPYGQPTRARTTSPNSTRASED